MTMRANARASEAMVSVPKAGAVLAVVLTMATAWGCQRASDLGPVADLKEAARIRKALIGEGGAAQAAVASTGTGWATLKGRFTFDGTPPEMPAYQVNKDQQTCAPGGEAPRQQFLLVDSATSGIANVVIYARNASRVHESAEPSSDPIVFDQRVCVFLTHVMGMTIGQPVEIKNSDPVGHNTKIEGRNTFNQTIPANDATPWKAQREETTPAVVRCNIHPWMVAYILARGNKYFAVTAPDGSFEIPNLPAGEEVELQVWHENAAGAQNSLVVETPQAKELKWSNKGRIKVKLEADEVREIDIAVPPAAFRGA